MFKALALGAMAAVALLVSAPNAGAKADNRCTPKTTPSSVAYSCWAAYPEAFYTTGVTLSTYRVTWTVRCGQDAWFGSARVHGAVHVVVNQFTQPGAYKLMINSDVCKVSVVARRVAGSGSITMDLFINQNHPAPAHN